MRILYHHRTRADDGQAVHIRALQRAFRDEGHAVQEVGLVRQGSGSPAGAPAPGEDGRGNGRERGRANGRDSRSRWGWVSRLPGFALELAEYAYSVPARRSLLREAARFGPDFIYERYAFGNAGGVMAAGRVRVPLVLEVNSPMVLELSRTRGLSFPRIARRMETSIFRGADRVCVVTRVLGDMLREMGVTEEQLIVTPNGVHLELYGAAGESGAARRAAAEALGLPAAAAEGVVFGFVGYYRAWHRLDLAIDALRSPGLAAAHLAVIGEGPAHDELVERAASRGVGGRVHFAGPRPHDAIPKLLPAFDVALIPAINPYASPLKLHEYMAASLPVVAPDQPNLREVLRHGENGVLVQPGDGDQLEAALLRLVQDAELRRRLGAAARRTIEEREMTWRGNARRVVRAVEELR